MAGMICGGWDPYEGGQVYEIPLGGTMMQQKFALGGSGSSYIYGLVDSTYREGMTKEECKTFVKTAISHAMARDGSSGGAIPCFPRNSTPQWRWPTVRRLDACRSIPLS